MTGSMTAAVEKSSTKATSIVTIVADIEQEHLAAEQAATEAIRHAAACGRALHRLKDQIPHGEFVAFIETHLTFTRQTASGYMRIAKAIVDGKLQMENASSIRGALKQLAVPKEPEQQRDAAAAAPPAPTYEVDTERKRQIANKAEERFWAVTGHIADLEEICSDQDRSLAQILQLDRVVAVADHDQLRGRLAELDLGIAHVKDLRRQLAEMLEDR